MVQYSQSSGEDPIQIRDDLNFVSKQDIAAGETHKFAYQIQAPRDYVIAIDAGTLLAPSFYDVDGEPVDDSSILTAQKHDRQQNPLRNAIVFEDSFDVFDYEKFRSDPEYFRFTNKPLVLDEKEYLYLTVDLPNGHADLDASSSRLTIGEKSTRMNQPCFIRRKDTMNSGQQKAMKQAQSGGK